MQQMAADVPVLKAVVPDPAFALVGQADQRKVVRESLHTRTSLLTLHNRTFFLFKSIWSHLPYGVGLEPDITHRSYDLASAGEYGVQQKQVDPCLAERRAFCCALGSLDRLRRL